MARILIFILFSKSVYVFVHQENTGMFKLHVVDCPISLPALSATEFYFTCRLCCPPRWCRRLLGPTPVRRWWRNSLRWGRAARRTPPRGPWCSLLWLLPKSEIVICSFCGWNSRISQGYENNEDLRNGFTLLTMSTILPNGSTLNTSSPVMLPA